MSKDLALKLLWVAVGIVLAFVAWSYVPNLTQASSTTTP